MSIKIVTDSTCDLPRELIHAHHISVIPLHINKGEDSFLDGLEITPEDIFSYVEKGGDICTTAAPNPMELSEYFEELSLQYEAVIMITIGSGFSSCYQNAVIAASEFSNVYIVDSKNLSSGQGIIVMEAAKMAEQGVSPEKICMRLESAASRVNASFILDRLDYMRKGGRCSSVAALGADLMHLKPCIEVSGGIMRVGKKYRGSLEKVMYQYTKDRISVPGNISDGRVYIVYPSAKRESVDAARQVLTEDKRFTDIQETFAGCTVACHCGPNTIGVMFLED